MKTIRTASICHGDYDRSQRGHKRIKLELIKTESGYEWFTDAGEDCCIGPCKTVREAEEQAISAWSCWEWDFRNDWRAK